MRKMVSKSSEESKLLWHIAFPAILTAVFQFSIGFVTTGFVGHIGEVELAAVTVVENVIEGFSYGVLLGMGSALETLCGQAVGAGQVGMLGVYIQRSWIICGATALALAPTYVFTAAILRAFHQPAAISAVAGRYTRLVIPQLFAYAANFPLQKFFQAQSKVWAMTFISGVGLAVHVALNYVFVTWLGHGLVGAAVVGNVTWWLIIAAQFGYLVSGSFPEAWKGFSVLAFKNLTAFVKLSLASAVMLCLELWYYTTVLILVGLLKHAQLQVDVMSVCINYQLWTLMVALGFNAAVSVRVSNELGANRPKAAKFSVIMAVSTSAFIGAIFLAVFLIWRTELPRFFTENDEVLREAAKLGYLLAATIFLNSIQPVLSGVAIGAGWQSLVALVNVVCYYFVGIPLGVLFGFKLKLGAMVRTYTATKTSISDGLEIFIPDGFGSGTIDNNSSSSSKTVPRTVWDGVNSSSSNKKAAAPPLTSPEPEPYTSAIDTRTDVARTPARRGRMRQCRIRPPLAMVAPSSMGEEGEEAGNHGGPMVAPAVIVGDRTERERRELWEIERELATREEGVRVRGCGDGP